MVKMKECTVFGDMTADRSSENYPEVPVCEDCIEADQGSGEESQIVSVGNVVTDSDAVCEFCGAHADD